VRRPDVGLPDLGPARPFALPRAPEMMIYRQLPVQDDSGGGRAAGEVPRTWHGDGSGALGREAEPGYRSF
jgi:hypothetical protein